VRDARRLLRGFAIGHHIVARWECHQDRTTVVRFGIDLCKCQLYAVVQRDTRLTYTNGHTNVYDRMLAAGGIDQVNL
jgi:hypothetical protein